MGLCLGPDHLPVFLNDPMHCDQTHPGSFKIPSRCGSAEIPEQSLGVFHVEASAAIAHENDRRFTRSVDAVDFDHGAGPATGVTLQALLEPEAKP